jgi:hypothetical protein
MDRVCFRHKEFSSVIHHRWHEGVYELLPLKPVTWFVARNKAVIKGFHVRIAARAD